MHQGYMFKAAMLEGMPRKAKTYPEYLEMAHYYVLHDILEEL